MPVERRSLRSNKDSSSTNNNSKEKSSHSRTASKSKAVPSKKGPTDQAAKVSSGVKPSANGAELVQNGINGSQDIEMNGESSMGDKMTVVVPPSKSPKPPGQSDGDDVAVDAEGEGQSKGDATSETRKKSREQLPVGKSFRLACVVNEYH